MPGRRIYPDDLHAARARRFATLLGDLLYALDLSHKDLAQALGVPRYTVDSWTRSEDAHIPGDLMFGRVCAFLDARRPGAGAQLAEAAGRTGAPTVATAEAQPAPAPGIPPAVD